MKHIVIFLICFIHSSAYGMDKYHICYDKFRTAFIQANEERMNKLWKELQYLPLREKVGYLEALMQIANKRMELGLLCVFERRCDRCFKPKSIQGQSETYCSC